MLRRRMVVQSTHSNPGSSEDAKESSHLRQKPTIKQIDSKGRQDKDLPLTLKNITNFLRENEFSSKDAQRLGIQLDIRRNSVQTLVANNAGIAGDYDVILAAIITYWLNNDREQSWDKLARALHNCDYAWIARVILRSQVMEHEQSEELQDTCIGCWIKIGIAIFLIGVISVVMYRSITIRGNSVQRLLRLDSPSQKLHPRKVKSSSTPPQEKLPTDTSIYPINAHLSPELHQKYPSTISTQDLESSLPPSQPSSQNASPSPSPTLSHLSLEETHPASTSNNISQEKSPSVSVPPVEPTSPYLQKEHEKETVPEDFPIEPLDHLPPRHHCPRHHPPRHHPPRHHPPRHHPPRHHPPMHHHPPRHHPPRHHPPRHHRP